MPPLLLSQYRYDAIIAHLQDSLPNEGCGLLAAIPTRHGERALHFFPGTNIDHSPVRFTMDPKQVIEAMWWMRTLGWKLAAIVHSHPRTAPEPSATDLREAYYPEARLLIVSFAEEQPALASWMLTGDGEARSFVPSRLVLRDR